MSEFGSVSNLLEHTDQLKGALKKKVEEHVEDIRMSHFLATIKTDVPVKLNLDELVYVQPDEKRLKEIFTELEFKSLTEKFLGEKQKNVKKPTFQLDLFADFATDDTETEKNSSCECLKTIQHDYQLIEKEEDIQKLCDFLLTFDFLSLDTETTSTSPIEAELVGLSFSVKENQAFYVALPPEREKAQKMIEILRPLYENPKSTKIGQNIKYDLQVLANYGINLEGELWDTMIAHYLIQPELRHNMDYMAEAYLNYKTIHIDELLGPKGKNQKNMRDLKPIEVYEYAAEDADVTLKLKNVLDRVCVLSRTSILHPRCHLALWENPIPYIYKESFS